VPNGYPICKEGTHLALQDYDNDAKLDAVVNCRATTLSDAAVTRLTNAGNDGNGLPKWTTKTYATGTASPVAYYPKRAFAADIDNDGMMDMVIADYSTPTSDTTKSYLTVIYGGADTAVHYATTWPDGDIDDMVVTDLNGDSRPDVILSSSTDGQAIVFLNNPAAATRAQRLTIQPAITIANIDGEMTHADIDEDGKQDLLFSSFDANAFFWLLGNGDGTFKLQRMATTDAGPESIAIGDLNGDGHVDVAVGTLNPANMNYEAHVDVFLGDGAGNFSAKTDISGSLPFQGSSIAVGDLNGDGLGEIVLGSQAHGGVYIFTNTSH
jgi:hypothetical protein